MRTWRLQLIEDGAATTLKRNDDFAGAFAAGIAEQRPGATLPAFPGGKLAWDRPSLMEIAPGVRSSVITEEMTLASWEPESA